MHPNPAFRQAPREASLTLARARGFGVLTLAGPDAYVSPGWYGPASEVPDQVPTWNYVAVHLRGVLHPLPEATLEGHLAALSAEHEGRLAPKAPWTSAKMSDGALARMTRAIVPFWLEVASVAGTWKLSQNKPAAVRARTARALAAGDAAAAALARLMEAPE